MKNRLRLIWCMSLAIFLTSISLWGVPVQILATGDMHGWLEPTTVDGQILGGTAQMLSYWRTVEGYQPEHFLLISLGDNLTGPALSTIYKGQSTVAVMNRMGYDLSMLGNHEFDYGQKGLQDILTWSKFPYLAGNLAAPEGEKVSVAGTLLYTEQGVKVGIIGLVTTDLPTLTNTNGLTVKPYAETVRRLTTSLREQGAEVIIVAAHAVMSDLTSLANEVSDLGIPLMMGGHSHEFGQQKVGRTWVINNGEWWKGYSRIDLDYDPATKKTVVKTSRQVWLQQPVNADADADILTEIASWKNKLDPADLATIGYSITGLSRPWGVGNFVADCWLAQIDADLVLLNQGGLRQNVQPGALSKLDLLSILPFDNKIYRFKMTGEQLMAYNPGNEKLLFAGVRKKGDQWLLGNDGKILDPKATYRVLTNDFLYNISPQMKEADANPETVAPNWREPVYQWLILHRTTEEQPLEKLVDQQPRIE